MVYRTYVSDFDELIAKENKETQLRLMDGITREIFDAKVIISRQKIEDGEELEVVKGDVGETRYPGTWYVKVLEREEEEDEITITKGKRLGQRRGYMLKSMLEEKEQENQEK